MDQGSSSVPTQPWVIPNNSWPQPQPNTSIPNPFTGYTCPSCGAWLQGGVWHQCPGWNPGTITTDRTFDFGLGDISMYADYVKLMKRETLKVFKERFFVGIEQMDLTDDVSAELEEIFDNVATGVGDESRV